MSLQILHSRAARQRGVASLVVVLVLFFIVSMVAAYTNRNLIFEQRTAANQYRSTQAIEAAQAGLEWAKAMLNGPRINPPPAGPSGPPSCAPSTTATDTTFRQRYISVDANGFYTARSINPIASPADQLMPSCVFNGTDWDCDCPINTAPSLTPTAGNQILPAFSVRLVAAGSPTWPGLIRIEAVGCTKWDPTCVSFVGQGENSEGRAIVTELVALTGGLPSPPLAALTAGGTVNLAGAAMTLTNTDVASGGVTVQAAGAVTSAGLVLNTVPGTPGSASVLQNDTKLPTTADRMFSGFFNMWPDTYKQQPAMVVLNATTDPANCTAAGCNATAVRNALLFNPGRVFWVEGDLVVDSANDIGSAAEPALIVTTGNLSFSGAGTGITIWGLVYMRTATWTTSGAGGTVHGAAIAEGSVAGNGTPTIIYDPAVLKTVRLNNGSIVKVPGGWKDFCSTGTGAMASPGTAC